MSDPLQRPPSQPSVDYLATATADDDLLAALADEFTARLRQGEHPQVDEYAERHPALAERIRKMLQAVAMIEHSSTADYSSATERVGDSIGRYKLLERIGEGGFGVVYMAEQQHPVRRKVALKVVKPGMDSRQVLARFEAERQALAIMDHPNIAKVFDAGATESGRPYFVMELIKGEPITEFCDRNQFSPHARLELFAQVCHAVQHAHQKGIIHRDIKPTNVLVEMHDTTPVVKVIDFGVAKALGQELTDKTLFTGFAQFLGTPLYMSPEQAGQSSLDVDTRSDIYSLGVLLYELLTGTTPFDKERFKKAAHDEILRIIREEHPPTPSTRLSSLSLGERAGVTKQLSAGNSMLRERRAVVATSLATISAQRQMEPAKLTRLVRGELDWIVMKALEKDRTRRYETATGLARDIERYLKDEPVEACPPSAVYRIKTFVRRNKGPVLAASLVLLMLIGGIAGTSFGLIRADRARRESQAREAETKAVLDFVEQKVFAAARPEGHDGGLGHDVTLRRAIEAAVPFVNESFADRPLIEARLRQTLGITFLNLGKPEKAAEQFEKAQTIRAKELGLDDPDTLKSVNGLGRSYDDLGRYAEAAALQEKTLTMRKVKVGADHPDTLDSMNNLAICYDHLGRYDEALKLHEETLKLRRDVLGPGHRSTFGSMINMANTYNALGRHAEAVKLYEEALSVMKAKIPEDSFTFNGMNGLASSYQALGRHAESLRLQEDVLALRLAKLGPDHPHTLSTMSSLKGSYENAGRHSDALRVVNDAIRQYPDNANFYHSRGYHHCQVGDFQKAMMDFDKAVELGSADPLLWYRVATLYLYADDVDRYRGACRELLDLADRHAAGRTEVAEQTAKTCALAPDSVADFSRVERLGQRVVTGTEEHQFYRWFILAKGLTDFRSANYKAAIEWLQRFAPKDDGTHSDASGFAVLAMAHHRLGQVDPARESLESAREIIAKKPQDWKRGTNWIDWMHCEILFREAVELLSVNDPKASEASSATTQ
jgi:serine/threonine protein kinase/tetratricopeptide (TPR) repeat protein